MKLTERLRPALLRWDRLLAAAALAAPFVVAILAGFAWMDERGLLVPFILASLGLGSGVALIRLAVSWWRRRGGEAGTSTNTRLHARMDPEWTAGERNAFEAARSFIEEKTSAPLSWDQLRPVAEEVIRRVANNSGQKGKGVLDFSVPEALLLIDRVTLRLRSDLRDHVPFADSISVGTLLWVWEHREVMRRVGAHGKTAWRVLRALKSLPIAILREIESAIAGGHTSFLTGEGTAMIQALLLEEVAAAAVDLYSGRLRFSDAELLDMRIAAGEEDRARLATADRPLRVAVAGQVSSGKSSLVNALLGCELAETDVVAATDRARTYPCEFDGVATVLLDLPGLDGSKRMTEAVMQDVLTSDMVIWTVRANRPAREIDRAALAELDAHFAARPERRRPPVVVAVTGIDQILHGWPFAENLLTAEAMRLVADIVAAVAGDIGDTGVHPVPVALVEPEWNTGTLRDRVQAHLGEALMAQRNRLRVESRASLWQEAARTGRGLRQGLSLIGSRATPRQDKTGKDDTT